MKDKIILNPYVFKLKDPRWQKKRLEILNRDNFTCRCCGDNENTLNVHHIVYPKSRFPWDTDNNNLITLCDYCHELWHHIFNGKFAVELISNALNLFLEWERDDIRIYLEKNCSHE
jgi:5-methylcytosine-specific restriction endonuclease McrA